MKPRITIAYRAIGGLMYLCAGMHASGYGWTPELAYAQWERSERLGWV